MASWRDSASAECQSDFERLLNLTLPFAQQMLAQHGAFFPYGAATNRDGQDRMIAGDTGNEKPPSADVLRLIYEGLRAGANDDRAAAVVTDFQLQGPPTDAIRVELEHREGVAIAVYLPYRKKRFGRGVEYGAMSASEGTRQIW